MVVLAICRRRGANPTALSDDSDEVRAIACLHLRPLKSDMTTSELTVILIASR